MIRQANAQRNPRIALFCRQNEAFNAFSNLLGHAPGAGRVWIDQNDHELVSSIPARNVRRPDSIGDDPSDSLEHLVTSLVSVVVIHGLEAVHIEEQQRKRRA